VERATTAVAVAAAAAGGAGEGERAVLEMDAATVKWACGELKLTKGQLTQSWEALVYRAVKAAPAAAAAFKRKVVRRLAGVSGSTEKAARKAVMDTESGFVMLPLPPPPPRVEVAAEGGSGGAEKTEAEAAMERATQAMVAATKGATAKAARSGGGGEEEDAPEELTLDEQYAQVLIRLEALTATLALTPC
jgi:hypothetical protein